MTSGLPIDSLLPQLREQLREPRNLVLEAPPGAGKSTVVPLVLLAEPWAVGRRVLLLEPRRLAARAVATRMAQTLGERVGQTVGWRMRLDTRIGPATRLEVVTEGVLARLLQEDAALEGVAAVIFDEYHERSLQADLGLAMTLDSQAQLAPALRILAMSATLEGSAVARLMNDAPVLRAAGRSFPVDVEYVGRGPPLLPGGRESPEQRLAGALPRILGETHGDVLAFLPGAPEIRRVQGLLRERLAREVRIWPLYGELGTDAQEGALAPAAQGRKLILATNIAETSLTIEGVRVVVDAGLVRRACFDPATGMSRLETRRISRASAEQRAGRAGRVAPGRCYRLWGEGAHASLAAFAPPEILEADLAPLVLELAAWGTTHPTDLAWLDPPPRPAWQQACDLLARLDALDGAGRITSHGRDMLREPVHPRLAHMLVRARAQGERALAGALAALLSERDLLRGVGRDGAGDADIRTRLELLQGAHDTPAADAAALGRARRSARALGGEAALRAGAGAGSRGAVGALLALAWPDRIAQRRASGDGRFLLGNGRGARFARTDALAREPWLVAVDLEDAEPDAQIRLAAPLEADDLETLYAQQIATEELVAWDEREQAVIARRRRRFGALVLEERPLSQPPVERVAAVMLEATARLGIGVLPWDEEARQLQGRLQLLHRLWPQEWPASDDATLQATLGDWLAPWLAGVTRRSQLAAVPLQQALRARLPGALGRRLDELAPVQLVLPTGSRARIDYLDENAPCVEARLQELFGLSEGPRIAAGSLAVTFKLLSPARRPVQITRDLGGFWRGSYAQVRRELRGRYPKHYWPEDPSQAEPTRGTRRPR